MGFTLRAGGNGATTTVTTTQGRSFVTQTRQQNEAMQPAASSDPVEIEAMDGQRMTVTFDDVRNFICKEATIAECRIFLETCKQYHLNPFTKEAYLIHYDNKNGDTASTIVLGKTCYMKMAEAHPQYDGFEAGVIVFVPEVGELIHREGSIIYKGEELVGGWAKTYRKDRSRPFYEEVNFSEYDTKKSLWVTKPATMIRKVALVHTLREAFPATFGGLIDESEVPVEAEADFRELSAEEAAAGAVPTRRRVQKPKKEEPAPLAVEADEVEGDPFANAGTGGDEQ
ncbi:phage recombination protein Bet [Faecalibacterium prausnitzii]|uniref:Phage recombination protein Bet n=1 Tax=Faecalibacterium prausnitzii TaxID=853 RepID=A0A3E2UDI4_9FIRM|nr:phage recombination protein Bet [Faecalibacterium prausnitzii]RGB94286.1 phage recombination protein Bet [Faecalibacterium prausnitzii]